MVRRAVAPRSAVWISRKTRAKKIEVSCYWLDAIEANGLLKGEGFAVDASVMDANASRYHGMAPEELGWTDAQRKPSLSFIAIGRRRRKNQRLGNGRLLHECLQRLPALAQGFVVTWIEQDETCRRCGCKIADAALSWMQAQLRSIKCQFTIELDHQLAGSKGLLSWIGALEG
jgi:hypothetical protein